ncbi:hypothetical protein HC891_05815 [Candidatus Gracilibacteria bacterium]|nr:hypothetical protein [Candidatus Gracilibacteria bacterium]
MKPDETKTVFLSLLGLPAQAVDQATIPIPPLPAAQLWAAFKRFAVLPLDALQQGFIFESGIFPAQGDTQQFVMTFRRYFFLAFDDDLDTFFQLCFETCLVYAADEAFRPWSIWFQVEVETDLIQAVDEFIRRVEEQHDLWQLVTQHEPVDAYIFQ